MNKFDVKFQNALEKINNIESSQDEGKNDKVTGGLGKLAYFHPKLHCNKNKININLKENAKKQESQSYSV